MVAIDRTTYAQHRRLQEARLPSRTDYLPLLDRFYAARVDAQLRDYAASLRVPLPKESQGFVNDCLAELDAVVQSSLSDAPAGQRRRAQDVLSYRVREGTTLQELCERDSFHSVLPFLDGPAMRLLLEPSDVPTHLLGELRDTLRHRALHGPQQTSYIFLHELAVGYYLNELEAGGAVVERRELTLDVARYAALPAFVLRQMAAAAEMPASELAALHFGTNAEVERRLPPFLLDLMMTAGHLYFLLEFLVLYRWKARNGLIIERTLQFFCLPALERFQADRSVALAVDASQRIEERVLRNLYGGTTDAEGGDANELDVIRQLVELSHGVWMSSRSHSVGHRA